MKTFEKAPLALAISALLVAPAALADNSFDTDSYMDSDVSRTTTFAYMCPYVRARSCTWQVS